MIFSRRLLELVAAENRPKQPEANNRLLSHDTWIYALAAAIGRVSHIDEPLCWYRQHGASAFGIAKRPILQRIRASTEVPLFRHQCRAEFYRAMAVIFDELKSSSDPALANAARLAAERYGQRCAYVQSRIRVYTGETISVRLKEFLRLPELHARGFAVVPRLSSRLKDFVLGVLGLGRVGPQRDSRL